MTGRRVVVVGPHLPAPSPAARLCARIGAEHAHAGASVLTVDSVPSAAERRVLLRGLPGAAAVAWLSRDADLVELVLVPGMVQRAGARSPEHRAIAAAWRASLRTSHSARVHVLEAIDLRQLGLHPGLGGPAGIEVVEHPAVLDPSPVLPRDQAAGPGPDEGWAVWAAAVARNAAADRQAGLSLRLPIPPPPYRSRNQRIVDHLRDRHGRPGRLAVQAILGTKRRARAAVAAVRRPAPPG